MCAPTAAAVRGQRRYPVGHWSVRVDPGGEHRPVFMGGGEACRKPRRLGLAGVPAVSVLQGFGVHVCRPQWFDHLERGGCFTTVSIRGLRSALPWSKLFFVIRYEQSGGMTEGGG